MRIKRHMWDWSLLPTIRLTHYKGMKGPSGGPMTHTFEEWNIDISFLCYHLHFQPYKKETPID